MPVPAYPKFCWSLEEGTQPADLGGPPSAVITAGCPFQRPPGRRRRPRLLRLPIVPCIELLQRAKHSQQSASEGTVNPSVQGGEYLVQSKQLDQGGPLAVMLLGGAPSPPSGDAKQSLETLSE